MQLQQEKQTAKSNLLRKCGLLAHTSAAFLKNCCTEKLFSLVQHFQQSTALRKTNCVQFGKIALLFVSVLFAGGCVV